MLDHNSIFHTLVNIDPARKKKDGEENRLVVLVKFRERILIWVPPKSSSGKGTGRTPSTCPGTGRWVVTDIFWRGKLDVTGTALKLENSCRRSRARSARLPVTGAPG